MNLGLSFLEALESISANKLRSSLTMLGIVIGVAAVIAMLAIGEGARQSITSQIESLGANLLFVISGGDADNPEPLTLEDAAAIADPQRAPSVSNVAPVLQGQVQVAIPGSSSNTSLVGVTPAYFEVQSSVKVAEGSLITQSQVDDRAAVVLLGTDVANKLFETTSGLTGKTIRVNGEPYKILGVLEEQGGTSFGSSDNRILMPLSTAQSRLIRRATRDEVDTIYVQAANSDLVAQATDEVSQILRARHRSNLGVEDFDILSTQSFLDTANSITATFTLFLGGIAGVSLLVGGIGIMNIMLVSVIERTREIGLRKAVGAHKRDILAQFLVESLILSLSGGAVGILVGWGISSLIGTLSNANNVTLNPVVGLNAILLATLFSAAVGIFFGLYPANRAANLEPVEALRSE